MPNQNCKVCGSPMRLIPSGVSRKTGNSYNEFYACPKGCKQPLIYQERPQTLQTQDKPDKYTEIVMKLDGLKDEIKELQGTVDEIYQFLNDNLGGD